MTFELDSDDINGSMLVVVSTSIFEDVHWIIMILIIILIMRILLPLPSKIIKQVSLIQ